MPSTSFIGCTAFCSAFTGICAGKGRWMMMPFTRGSAFRPASTPVNCSRLIVFGVIARLKRHTRPLRPTFALVAHIQFCRRHITDRDRHQPRRPAGFGQGLRIRRVSSRIRAAMALPSIKVAVIPVLLLDARIGSQHRLSSRAIDQSINRRHSFSTRSGGSPSVSAWRRTFCTTSSTRSSIRAGRSTSALISTARSI